MSGYEPTVLSIVKLNDAQSSQQGVFDRLRYLFLRVCSCRHRKMSRPFTRDGDSYIVCVRCGMRRGFDLQTWKAKGPFYNDQRIVRSTGPGKTADPRVTRLWKFHIYTA